MNELAAALARAQGKMDNAKKLSSNPHYKSSYADLATIWDVIREPLSSEGLSVMQVPVEGPEGRVTLETTLFHASGQTVSSRYSMGLKDANNPQQVGSLITYMRRYALLGLCGIASEDDDGEAATPKAKMSGTPSKVSTPVVGNELAAQLDLEAVETLAFIETCSSDEARASYRRIKESTMPEPWKTKLLSSMVQTLQKRPKALAATPKDETL